MKSPRKPIEKLFTVLIAGVAMTGCLKPAGEADPFPVPERHRAKLVMGRDYWTLLYSYFFANPGWDAQIGQEKWMRQFDNAELRALPVFRDCAICDNSCRPVPKLETGSATYRTVRANFYEGNQHYEGMEACAKMDKPLTVTFGAKRSPLVLGGKIDLDCDDFAKWKARHPNLFVFGTLGEWENDLDGCVRFAFFQKPTTNALFEARRKEVREFFGHVPSNRYDRVAAQRKFFDRHVDLYYGDRDHIGALHCSSLIGNLAAAWGAREIVLETTNTTGPDDGEMRWDVAGMFARGTARQFGIPWGWYVAIFMNGYETNGKFVGDSVCNYPASAAAAAHRNEAGGTRSAAGGISQSLNRRAWYYAYLSGANSVEQEGWHAVFLQWDKAIGKIGLSPRGKDFAAFHDFTAAHPNRGTPYTPVAILVPFAQGYAVEGCYSFRNSGYGYTPGDQTVDSVFFSLVPGFARSAGLKKGGEYNLHNTPMAMMYDVINPDAPQDEKTLLEVFRSYRALVLTGDYPDRSFEKTLAQYEREGGRVIRIDPKSLPPVGDFRRTTADIRAGRRTFPSVAAQLKVLQDEYFPFRVEGDVQYGANRVEVKVRGEGESNDQTITKSNNSPKWWLWAFNNRGVTKFADREQQIDPTAVAPVKIGNPATSRLSFLTSRSRVTELLSGKSLPVSGGAFSYTIAPGDLAIFEIEVN